MEFKPMLFLKPEPIKRPQGLYLLQFGGQKVAVGDGKVREPNIHKVLSKDYAEDLRAIKYQQNIDEAECQTNFPASNQVEGDFLDVIGLETGKSLRQVQVKRNEEVFIITRPKPFRKEPEAPPKPTQEAEEPAKQDTEQEDEGKVYVAKMLEDPLWEYKQTMEVKHRQFKLKEMHDQLTHVENYSSKLNAELHSRNTELQRQYNELLAERKALLSMRQLEEPQKEAEAQPVYFEDQNLLEFYAYNQALLAEIEAKQRAKLEQRKPEVKTIKVTKLTPAVKKRPENWRSQNAKAHVTTRMTKAFQEAERAIKESNRVKRLMGSKHGSINC